MTTDLTKKLLDRRQLLRLAAAALLAAAGCTNVRQGSDLDAAVNELDRLLDEMDDDQQRRLVDIVQRIQARARELAGEHRTFTDSFDRMLTAYDATEAQLERLTADYNRQRRNKRNELLRLQDELHAAVTPEDWSDIVRALNRAGQSLAGYTLSGN